MFEYETLGRYRSKNKVTIDCLESTEPVNIIELLSGYRKTNRENKDILRELIDASSMLQSRHKMIENFNEDQINVYLQDLLRPKISNKGFFTNEQSLKGSSFSKKQVGELDISIETIEGKSITFYEGFVLKYLDKAIIDKHIIKTTKNYDPNGLKEKFVGVYCYAENYIDIYQKYMNYVNTINIEGIVFISIKDLSDIYVNGSEMKVFRSLYSRNSSRLVLYHILINLNL